MSYSSSLRIMLAQMSSGPDAEANLDWVMLAMDDAAAEEADLIVFPEYATLACSDAERPGRAQGLDGEHISTLRECAARLRLACFIGSFAEVSPQDGKSRNTSVFIGADGKILATYSKAHLFEADLEGGEVYRESHTVEAGPPRAVVVDYLGWKFGLSICYDLRFPELYRALSAQGADVMLVPSSFTMQTGEVHWEVLLRARAIENLAWVVAPAQTGTLYGSRKAWGHSMVVSPWGEMMADMGKEPGLLLLEIDKAALKAARTRIPALDHRL